MATPAAAGSAPAAIVGNALKVQIGLADDHVLRGCRALVVIVSYKVTRLTIDCLRSLRDEVARVPGCQVAVCENGTGPEAVAELQRAITDNGWGDWVTLLHVHPNRGYTGGTNVVLRMALASATPPEYFVLLNADTLVDPNAIKALVDFMDAHPRVGMGGSKLLSAERKVMPSPYRFHGIANEFDTALRLGIVSRLLARWNVVAPVPAQASEAQWVSGASIIVRREVFQKMGLLDEDYFCTFDDIDMCRRSWQAGWPVWYVPESTVVHLVGASTGIANIAKPRPRYWFVARRRYFLKFHSAWYAALADLALMTGLTLWAVRRRVQRKQQTMPPGMLAQAWQESVFRRGFKVPVVENPALASMAASERPARHMESTISA